MNECKKATYTGRGAGVRENRWEDTCLGVELPPLPVSEEEVLADVSLQHSNGQSVSEMEENSKICWSTISYFYFLGSMAECHAPASCLFSLAKFLTSGQSTCGTSSA